MTTEIASQKYTTPASINTIGISSIKHSATAIPPRNIEPVSPMNTFAGCLFHIKKPIQPPKNALAATVHSLNCDKSTLAII